MIPEDILKYFDRVRTGSTHLGQKFIVSADKGDVAELLYYQNEWTIYIDNFPGRKLYYKYNFPIRDHRQFHDDMLRLGLALQYKKTVCESCQKIKDCEGCTICGDCDSVELN